MCWPRCALCILLIQLFVVPCIHGLGILLPLYIYPNGTNCAAWSPVFDAISANSNAQWYIIINPDTGPGPTDELYETCVTEIPASANQIIMGFVDTTAGNVLGDIDTYAGWPASSRPHGIFFAKISATASQLSTYQSYVSHARSQGFGFIGLDPGETVTDPSYFSMANLTNTYEDSYASFNPASLTGTMSQQSVILVNSPTTGTYTAVISQLENLGVGAVYISTVADTSQALPAQLSEFASEVASAKGGGSTGSNDSSGTTTSNPAAGNKPPIAAIVGAVIGALIILLIFLVIFLRLRRRRSASAPEADRVVPFIEVRNLDAAEPVALSRSWNTDIKVPQPALKASTSADNTTMAYPNLSVRVSYPTTLRLSGAPTYGSAWGSPPFIPQ
ncbi:hypothetical protein MSAN_00530200 [Mycena sanguinolenta]|uniref:Spherulin 4-like cell surface protein n=1 Tax=Mycena sanguinolenta TaxID=230812 RepID=A0A8H6ZA94_9AGAR|nr:hypothetical protein MSAN_00530200 [Mycena sanguinolenta]